VTPGDAFHLGEVIARCQHVRVEQRPGADCKVQIANAVGAFDRATHQITTILHVPGPGKDHGSEHEISCGLEALPSALLAQLIADPSEAVSRLVVAELRADDGSQPDIGVARSFAVPTLDAETDRAAVDQAV
jgi:hypothetical protein